MALPLTLRILGGLRFAPLLYCCRSSQGWKGLAWLSTKSSQQSANSERGSQSGPGPGEQQALPEGPGSPPSSPLPSLSLPGNVPSRWYHLGLSWATSLPVHLPTRCCTPRGLSLSELQTLPSAASCVSPYLAPPCPTLGLHLPGGLDDSY